MKLLYGSAFRAPNAYEVWYTYGPYKANPALEPERIRTVEAVFEQQFARRYRVSAGVFRYWVTDLINQQVDPADDLLVYANSGDVNATGVELEIEGRLARRHHGARELRGAGPRGRRHGRACSTTRRSASARWA